MDTTQKELLSTYLRKRNIASEQNDYYYSLTNYETEYVIAHPEYLESFKNEEGKFNKGVCKSLMKYGKDKKKIGEYIGEKGLNDLIYNLDGLIKGDAVNKKGIVDYILNYKKSTGYYNISGYDIADVTKHIPDYFGNEEILKHLDNYTSRSIIDILSVKPELLSYFINKVNEFNNTYIIELIGRQPILYDHLTNLTNNFTEKDYREIERVISSTSKANGEIGEEYLLKYTKNLTSNINLFKKIEPALDKYDLRNIIMYAPEVIKYIDTSKFERYDISNILKKQPQVLKYLITTGLTTYDFQDIMEEQPDFAKYITNFDRFNDDFISKILINNPSSIKYLKKELDKHYIVYILMEQPKLVEKFNTDRFTSYDVMNLIEAQPILAKSLNTSVLDSWDIMSILNNQPLAIKYLDLRTLSDNDKIKIIRNDPTTIKYIDIKDFDLHDIRRILSRQPRLHDYILDIKPELQRFLYGDDYD